MRLSGRSTFMRKIGGIADASGLEEVTALVGGDDFEAGPDGEANTRDKRIPEADTVDVLGAGAEEEIAAGLIAGEETVEDGEVYVGGWADFWRGRGAFGVRRGLDEAAEEPTGESAEFDFFHWRVRCALKRGDQGREIGVGSGAEMIEALADAPGTGSGLPVELLFGEAGDECFGRIVVGVAGSGEAERPSGRGDRRLSGG